MHDYSYQFQMVFTCEHSHYIVNSFLAVENVTSHFVHFSECLNAEIYKKLPSSPLENVVHR